jgi:hypothetical protein
MPQLDNYLVSLGMKGQDVILSTMDKIRKKGKDVTKKLTIPLAAKTVPAKGGKAAPEKTLPEEKPKPGKPSPEKPSKKSAARSGPESKPSDKPALIPGPNFSDQERNNKRFSGAIEKFDSGVRNFAGAAASLDPTAAISSVTSALGTSLSGISVLGVSLGRLPEGIAAIANSTLAMANNSAQMAKQATAAFYQLTTRNAAAAHYGERITAQGPLSRNERAMFIDAVSNSMGRIQQPLADEINKLIGKKDTRALARVGAGDWESTGTDKGWMIGQVANSFAGLPPSVKQKLQASLLKNYSAEIQDMAPGQEGAQRQAATWQNMEEDQTAKLAERAPQAVGLARKMNDMQLQLYNTGLMFASSIDKSIAAMKELPATIDNMQKAMKSFVNDPSVKNARSLMKSIKVDR